MATPTDPTPVGPVLARLSEVALQDGAHELSRARGKRGIVTLTVRLVLGDHGRLLESTHSVAFESKLHIKDGFKRGTDG